MIKNLKSYLDNFLQESPDNDAPNLSKIELATAVLMIEISLADESIGDEEYNTIKNILLEQFTLNKIQIDELISSAENEVDHAVSLHEFSEIINNELSLSTTDIIYKHNDKQTDDWTMLILAFSGIFWHFLVF